MEERETPHPDMRNRESRPPSRLLTVGLALLTLSALYLLGPAHAAMGWPAAVAVLLHIGLGLLLTVPIAVYAVRTKGRNVLFLSAFALCALTGLYLTVQAAIGQSTAHAQGGWWTHLLAGFLSILVFGSFLPRRFRFGRSTKRAASVYEGNSSDGNSSVVGDGLKSFARGASRRVTANKETLRASQILGFRAKDFAGTNALLPASKLTLFLMSFRPKDGPAKPRSEGQRPLTTPLCLLLLVVSTLGLGGTVILPHYDAVAYYRDTTATNAAQAENPLFPAGVRLAAGSRHTAEGAGYCGRAGCHTTALQEWQDSVHQWAANDPVYRRVSQEYVQQAGPIAAQWCAGCHEPLSVVQEGRWALTSTAAVGSGTNEGVGCVGCHAMTDVSARTGNGRFTLSLAQNYPFADRQTGWQRRMHDFLLRVRPAPHQTAYLKSEIHASSEFCGTCHRQSFNVPQNGYQFVHGTDEWGTWQSGPFSGRMARTAGLRTEAERSCEDCHFLRRPDGKFSHAAFPAGTWLASASARSTGDRPDASGFRQRAVNLDIFALRRPAEAGKQEAWIAPLDASESGVSLHAGETYLLDIVVSNRNVGHEFPAGYLDIEEAWLEVTLQDGRGRALAESGRLTSDPAALPPDTHAYRSIPLDRNGSALEHHELWKQVTTAYRRAIPSGGADIARYRLTVPRLFTSPLTVTARLRCRSLRPDFARWVGLPAAAPVTTLAEETLALPALGAPGRLRPESETALRFVEYGLGLLAPKDAPDAARARRAFLAAQRLAPNRPEPFLGLGRAYLVEPELLAAKAQFNAALRLAPDSPAAQADLGVVYSKQGEYDHALNLLRPLAQRFPQDGTLQFDLGLTLFRSGDYVSAVTAFQNSLAADPDNAAAHFQLKQCFQHLQRVPEARREEAIGQYLAEDPLASLLVPPFLSTHPDIRQTARPIPEHRMRPDQR
ncbi:MAG: putative system TPR-repeat lipoprotein [Chthonomonadaceae bacterium]|nr:putative system TPR-repeat lipoprotein [Chthonomonadaceae bacterium]